MLIPSNVRKAVAAAFLASLTLSLTPAVVHADSAEDIPTPPSPVTALNLPQGEQRYIVKYSNDANAESESESLREKGIEVQETLSHVKASVVVGTPKEMASVQSLAEVETVEVDQPVSISGATSIWGLDRVDQRTGRDGQYNIGYEGAGVNVYVVDTGLYMSHSEFSGRVPTAWSGINDGNGAHDCNGHGTHVAGTVAGTNYGIAKKANIIPLRALDCGGNGWSSTVISAINWAVAHHTAGQPAVMNMSIGGFTSASLQSGVQKAIDDGITVVAAAGNSNTDACNASPANFPAAITVAATDINDTQASFSSYGSCVDVQAPGVAIRSAYNNAPTGYNTLSGTSMATPHVAGAAAIMLSRTSSLTPAQVHQRIIDESTVGVVRGNKGSTPNRLLFIPTLSGPSCSNLNLGDAWAGVGLTCKANGGAASDSDSGADSDVVTGIEASDPDRADPVISDDPVPATPVIPAPADSVEIPVKEQPAPAITPAPVPAEDTAVTIQDSSGPVPAAVTSISGMAQIEITVPEKSSSQTAYALEPITITRGDITAAASEIPQTTDTAVQAGSFYQIATSFSLVVAVFILFFSMIAALRSRWNYRS